MDILKQKNQKNMKKIRELIDIEKSTIELLQTSIDKIEIDKDKNIEIFYRFMI